MQASSSPLEAVAPGAATGPIKHSANDDPTKGTTGRLLVLSVAALGVVYGDIGTSPLYALRECFSGHAALAVTPANVLGVLSLILWSLILVVSTKYLVLVLRADNQGEGGILALMALVQKVKNASGRLHVIALALGIFGAALLYGDGAITPAISVLSAVEGMAVHEPRLARFEAPLAIIILVALFLLQRRGTAGIGAIFGPITLVWLLALVALGISGILMNPGVLVAANPIHGVLFFVRNGRYGFFVLGAVFLALTGAEALYADMGHFGRRPIRVTWFFLVLPALVLNYFGQGALLLSEPSAVENPFYLLAPSWAVFPLVALATAAACIASQAVISGAYSLTRQAVQLGFCPRMEIVHTSATEIGQIYVPAVNWLLMVAVIGIVIGFRTSSSLAAAYGIAVSSTMVITAALALIVAMRLWNWKSYLAVPVFGLFVVVDLAFLAANAIKMAEGGWFPILLASLVFLLMTTWKRGRDILAQRLSEQALPLDAFVQTLDTDKVKRVSGTAVFMTGNPQGTPPALLHQVKHSRVIHERIVLLTVHTAEVPHLPPRQRVEVQALGHRFFRAHARYGFMETPNMPELIERLGEHGLRLDVFDTTFVLGRETLIAAGSKGMARWRKRVFAWMSRNARPATSYFGLPPNRVMELGARLEL